MELNNTQIQEILPHRYPFLLVDKIVECEPGKYAKGIKCVSANEMHFMGHFPGRPVMPGVLIIEAMAQTGAVVALTMEENKGKLVFFGGINKARFRKQVEPGDVLEMEVTMTKYKSPVGIATAIAKVGDEVACTAEFTFAIGDAQ